MRRKKTPKAAEIPGLFAPIGTLERQVEISGQLGTVFDRINTQILAAVEVLDFIDLAESNPRAFVSLLKDYASVLSVVADIERKALVLADQLKVSDPTQSEDASINSIVAEAESREDQSAERLRSYLDRLGGS